MGPRSKHLAEIRALDPERDHKRIVFLDVCHEFPWDITRSLELALFRTFAVPSIAALLDRTGEFYARPQKRYDDTDLIVSMLLEEGYDSENGTAALRRMNQIHGRFAIANHDLLYVLSTFVLEPIRWNRRFGWRPMIDHERLAMFHCWREIGRRMNIKALPDTFDELELFNLEYERDQFRYNEAGRRVADACLDLFAGWFPAVTRAAGKHAFYALLDEPLIDAFGFPRPHPALRVMVEGVLQARGLVMNVLPRRRTPRRRTTGPHRSYPTGYSIDELGPLS